MTTTEDTHAAPKADPESLKLCAEFIADLIVENLTGIRVVNGDMVLRLQATQPTADTDLITLIVERPITPSGARAVKVHLTLSPPVPLIPTPFSGAPNNSENVA